MRVKGGLMNTPTLFGCEDNRTVVKHTEKVPVTVRQLYTCYHLEWLKKILVKEFFDFISFLFTIVIIR